MARQPIEHLNYWPEIKYMGDKLREVREELKMTQREFAEHIGVAQSYISEFEKGGVHPPFLALVKLAARCNRPPSYFILERTPAEVRATPEPKKSK